MNITARMTLIGMLLGGTASYSAEHAPNDCQQALDRLAWLEDTTRRSLADLERVRKQAQGLSEWFGAESFGAYIAAMRQQERTLRAQLDELRHTKCGE